MLPMGFKKEMYDQKEMYINTKRRLAMWKTEDGRYMLCSYTEGKGKNKRVREFKLLYLDSYKKVLEYIFKNY